MADKGEQKDNGSPHPGGRVVEHQGGRLYPWPKGVSGNPQGMSRNKRLMIRFRRWVDANIDSDADEAVFRAWFDLIRKGDWPAIKEYLERRAGKIPTPASVDVTASGPVAAPHAIPEEDDRLRGS